MLSTLTALDKAARYTFKVGDIVFTSNGTPAFYRVTKRTACFVSLQRLQSEIVETSDAYGQSGCLAPLNIDNNSACDPTPRTRIKTDEEGNEEAFIDGKWFLRVAPYNGQPKQYCSA